VGAAHRNDASFDFILKAGMRADAPDRLGDASEQLLVNPDVAAHRPFLSFKLKEPDFIPMAFAIVRAVEELQGPIVTAFALVARGML
jgi:hypothetical protein